MSRDSSPDGYKQNAAKAKAKGRVRFVLVIPKDEMDSIDDWGIRAGYENRTTAVRDLLQKGLVAIAERERQ